MKIFKKNAFCLVESTNPNKLNKLKKLLSFKDNENLPYCFFKNNKFPIGLLHYVKEHLHISYTIYNKQNVVILTNTFNLKKYPLHKLYEHQIKGFKIALQNHTGIFNWATNAGKTLLILLLAKNIKGKVAIFCESKDVFTEIQKAWEQNINEKLGIIQSNKIDIKQVTLCMIPTINSYITRYKKLVYSQKYARIYPKKYKSPSDKIVATAKAQRIFMLDYLKSLDGFINDEVHHVKSKRNYIVNLLCKNAYFRYGFSGTAQKFSIKLENMKVIAGTGNVLHTITNDYCIKLGISAKPIVYIYKIFLQQPEEYEFIDNYNKLYNKIIVNGKIFNDLILKLMKTKEATFIPVKNIAHGKYLQSKILKSAFISGADDKVTREKYKKQFIKGKIQTIITTVFKEGANLPDIRRTINANLGKSLIYLLQTIIGRSLRKKKINNKVKLIDFYITGSQYFEWHSIKRVNEYKKEGFKIIYK